MRRKLVITAICSIAAGTLMWSFPAVAQQKTAKACQEEWRANKADNQAKGITEKAYVDQCRTGTSSAQPKTAPATPAPAASPPAKPAATAATPAKPAAPGKPAAAAADQFAAESEAKARCPSDTVVWVNLSSKIYHFAGTKDYGKTKRGAYVCEKDTATSGFRAAKDEKHP
jgi:hypothetical protein